MAEHTQAHVGVHLTTKHKQEHVGTPMGDFFEIPEEEPPPE